MNTWRITRRMPSMLHGTVLVGSLVFACLGLSPPEKTGSAESSQLFSMLFSTCHQPLSGQIEAEIRTPSPNSQLAMKAIVAKKPPQDLCTASWLRIPRASPCPPVDCSCTPSHAGARSSSKPPARVGRGPLATFMNPATTLCLYVANRG